MALTSCSSAARALDAAQRRLLLDVAHRAIGDGLRGRAPGERLDGYAPALCAPAATFVTLTRAGELRGCIGTLEACRPLVIDTSHNAYAAAFRDPRFPALTSRELDGLDVHISVLNPPEPLAFADEDDLIAQLRPGIDGLILSEGRRKGTFLPAVWDSVPGARAFLTQLKLKAGLPADYWSSTLKVERYTTVSIP